MALFLPQRWQRQPQIITEIDRSTPYASSIFGAVSPGLADTLAGGWDSAKQRRVTFNDTAPTVSPNGGNRAGRYLQFDVRGGAYGASVMGWPNADHASATPLTLIWTGLPGMKATGVADDAGYMWVAGRGDNGSWSLRFGFNLSGDLQGAYTDNPPSTSPAATLTLGIANGSYQRIAYKKVGTSVTVYHWATRTTATTSGGNGGFRDSTASYGLHLGPTNSATTTGASICQVESFLAYGADVADSHIWSLLDNPWQVYSQPARRYFMPSAGAAAVFIPIVGRGPGMSLAEPGGGLVGGAR